MDSLVSGLTVFEYAVQHDLFLKVGISKATLFGCDSAFHYLSNESQVYISTDLPKYQFSKTNKIYASFN